MAKEVIVIVGPTASGKSALAIELAKALNGEIISADSRQIYKLLNIGTAKPTPEELKEVKHHFIDHLDPEEYYNVSIYERQALRVIEQLFEQGKQPIVAGGSGLYIRALVDGIFDEGEIDFDLRDELMEERDKYGNEHMYNKLKELDPEAADTMLPQNWKRVIRALEVFYSTGKSILYLQNKHKRELSFSFQQYGLRWDREVLYRRIEERVDKMFEEGLLEEVRKLREMGLTDEINSLNTVGYVEIFSYFHGHHSLDRAKELIKRNTRRFAKRQYTWFGKDERIQWFDVKSENDLVEIKNIISNKIRSENEREN